tara:strand:- start:127 stop:1368 length:1242 start_codon:yes stop_codon:yes gene_type:complete
MSNRQGVWSLVAQYQAIADQDWTMAPGAPTGVSATAGDAQATVAFSAPSFTGIPAGITGFKVTSSEGETATGSSSPLTVTGLTNGTSYTFSVQAQNAIGFGASSSASSSVSPAASVMQIFGGRRGNGTMVDTVQRITISTTGNSVDTCNLTSATGFGCVGGASATRGVQAHGLNGSFQRTNVVDYTTFASTSDASDFGDLTNSRGYLTGLSNDTRFLVVGGGINDSDSTLNYIDYFTIASTGNGTDFGDTNAKSAYGTGGASSTRGIYANGQSNIGSATSTNVVEYVTIASTGNGTDFGDLQKVTAAGGGASNDVKFLVLPSDGSNNFTVDQFTIASTGNGTDFGDIVTTRQYATAGASSVRIVFAGGEDTSSSVSNVMQYFTIASAGNSTDFGDLSDSVKAAGSNTNAHGGI